MINIIESRELKEPHAPTTLNLLHFRTPILDGTRIGEFRQRLHASNELEGDYQRVEGSLEYLLRERDKKLNRINQYEEELGKQTKNTLSSMNFSKLYLEMREQFPKMPASDFISAFKRLHHSYIKAGSLLANEGKGYNIDIFANLAQKGKILNLNSKLIKVYKEARNNIPPSFEEKRGTWETFMGRGIDSMMRFMLDPKVRDYFKALKTSRENKPSLALAVPDGIPDWFSEDMQDEPPRIVVEEEIEEDKQELEKNIKQLEKIHKQKQYVADVTAKKEEKAFDWMRHKNETTFSVKKGFSDIILLLHEAKNLPGKIRELVKGFRTSSRKPISLAENPQEQIEEIIKIYCGSDDILESTEPYAIFLEKQLIDVEAIKSSTDLVDDMFVNFFTHLLNNPTDQEIKNTDNKKLRETIKYGIKPLLKILNEEEIDYVKEFIQSSQGQNVESFIWELSELLASKFKTNPHTNEDPAVKKVIDEIKRFSATFLRKHWEWTYDNLKNELSKTNETKQKNSEQGNQKGLIPSATEERNDRTNNEIEDVQDAISELQEGNLSGWQIFYSTNRTTDPKHLIRIPGTTLDEREREMEGFFQIEGIHPSIKTSSIINVFDQLPTTPDTVEWIRMRKEVNGEVFRKIKRGKGRILYIMDPDKKEFVFFYEQKKAWSYSFE